MSEPRATADVIRELRALFASGALPRPAFERAMADAGAARRWRHHADWLLVTLGTGFLLGGIAFFVASNWSKFDATWKLGALQAAVALCVIAAWNRGFESVAGRAFAFGASVLVGVFLAAFGQVYPTGADAWEMLRAWAALILVWVVASRAPEQWLLLLAIIDGAIALWFEHVQFYDWGRHYDGWLLLSATQVSLLVGLELARIRGAASALPWSRWVLVPVVLWFLSVATTSIVVGDHYRSPRAWLLLLLFGAVLGFGARAYLRAVRDLFALTCLGFTAIWTGAVVLFRVVDLGRGAECGSLVLIGIYVIGALAWLVRWIRRLAAQGARNG